MLSKMDLLTGDVEEKGEHDVGDKNGAGAVEDGLQPRRPPPPPPSSVSRERPGQDSNRSVAVSEVAAEMLEKAQMMDEGYLAVDGLSEKQVDEYFRQADVGNDGRVAGHEAMRFFLKSGLASSMLSKIWQRAKPPEIVSLAPEGLDKHQFSLALRLVAFAQQSYDLDNEQMVLAAMDPELWASMGYPPLRAPLFTEENMTQSEVQESSPRRSRSPIRPAGARNLHKAPGGSSTEFRPLPYEVRYPPLHANESAKLSDIMSVDGFLMAYPSFENGLLVWGSAESKIVDIETEHSRSLLRLTVQKERTHTKCKTEDDDAAQCVEISHITYKNRKISCCLLDKNRRILWVADKDGWISGYTVANINAKAMAKEHLIHQWRACRVGFVTSMTVALNNELWTGNSRGVIRVWPHTAGTPTVMSIFNPFSGESDMKGRELRKSTFDKAHSSKVIALHTAANGYTIWSVSKKSILLWDAGSGVCFGSIGSESNNSSVRPNFFQEASSTAIIDKNHGMELDPLTGSVLWRPAREDYGYCHTQQESWASMSERGVVELTERITDGAGKAVSFIGRLGVKMKTGSTKGSASLSKYDEASLDSYTVSNAHHNTILSNIFTMIAPHDDTMWVGHLDGTIHVYTSAGKVIDQISLGAHITCMAEIAREVWVGTGNGEVFRILTNNRSILGKFRAHKSSLKSITQTGVRAFTLAADGSISGWGIGQDSDRLRACWDEYKLVGADCFTRTSLGVLAVTWNCGESKPGVSTPFFRWIQEHSSDKSLIVVALQEVEMGGASVALAAAKETLAAKSQERGNSNAQFWVNAVGSSLGTRNWSNVSLRQLSGMLVMVFARSNLSKSLGEVYTSAVACGILGVGGNKGAVAVQLTLFRHRFVFICSHFAAHQHAVEVRNANYYTIMQDLNFRTTVGIFDEEDDDIEEMLDVELSPTSDVAQVNDNVFDGISSRKEASALSNVAGHKRSNFLKNIDAAFWMGDFNYRIDGNYEQVCQLISSKELSPLLLCDQLKREHGSGRVFQGFREPDITFAPTYKFDKGATGEFAYDSSEKKRIPAWCDRIMYKANAPFTPTESFSSKYHGVESEDKVEIVPVEYDCWKDVVDSDHKPVYGSFKVSLTKADAVKKRNTVADILAKYGPDPEADGIPRFSLSPHTVKLHPFHMPDQMITLQNKGSHPFWYSIRSEKPWDIFEVEVRPANGIVEAGQSKEIFLKANSQVGSHHHKMPRDHHMRNLHFVMTIYSEFAPGGSLELHTKKTGFDAVILHDA